jgi:hypothetical protein
LSWKVYIPSKHARFGIKSLELCETKSGYAWNFIFDDALKTEPYGSNVVSEAMTPFLNSGCSETWTFGLKLYSKKTLQESWVKTGRESLSKQRRKEDGCLLSCSTM